MLRGKFLQDLLASLCEGHDNLPPVPLTGPAMDHAVRFHAIHQFHGAVVANLQALGQIADGGTMARAVEALDGQQQLVLLRFQTVVPRSFLAEMQKLPDVVAELR